METLDAAQIEAALALLDRELARQGVRAELYVVGGAVMCLALHARPSTKDIDGWFTEPVAVRAAAKIVADELGLPAGWLNDAAKAYIPQGARFEKWRSFANLEISLAEERTLLAMKCAAARTAEDAGDIRILAGRLGLRSAEAVLAVALEFYPASNLPVRAQLLLEELFG